MAEHEEFLLRTEVALLFKVSTRTLERWAVKGIGPQPVKLGPRLVRYRPIDVDACLTQEPARAAA